jgi:post-segregation antitoxin (ccd killing protein)
MRNLKFFFLVVLATSLSFNLWSQAEVDQVLSDFKSDNWAKVSEAKDKLENYEEKAIPKIIALLESPDIIKLKNTGTLIYPGAEKVYGYGQMVDYDIDKIAVRAGWLLEDISFNNFGFNGIHQPDENLIGFIKLTFPDYYNNSTNRKNLENISTTELRKVILQLSVKKAQTWWQEKAEGWTRLNALVDALKSFDEKRQVKALFYIRNGDTKCTGLTKDYYIENISKEIVRLSGSDTQRISENARLILFDTKLIWLEAKMH